MTVLLCNNANLSGTCKIPQQFSCPLALLQVRSHEADKQCQSERCLSPQILYMRRSHPLVAKSALLCQLVASQKMSNVDVGQRARDWRREFALRAPQCPRRRALVRGRGAALVGHGGAGSQPAHRNPANSLRLPHRNPKVARGRSGMPEPNKVLLVVLEPEWWVRIRTA